MSTAWETTDEDIEAVLAAHGMQTPIPKGIAELIRENDSRIEKAALLYTEMEDQAASALDEIENILIEKGLIPGEKDKAFFPNDYQPKQGGPCPKIKGDCAAAHTEQGRTWCNLAEQHTDEFDECPEQYPEQPERT